MMQLKAALSLDKLPYTTVSTLTFAAFHLLLFPIMMAGALIQLDTLYKTIVLQSIVLTAVTNYLAVGTFKPGTIYAWYVVGIPLYALAGWLLGLLLQSRFSWLPTGVKLIGSLLLFEVVLSSAVLLVDHWDLLSMAAGW